VVRRAKLYYLRGRTGKAARITERPRDTTRGRVERGRANSQLEPEAAPALAAEAEDTSQSE
jgi:large subunit ribosomal protein L19